MVRYKIIYDNGIIQYKNLISHDIYVNIIKQNIISIMELESNTKISKKDKNLMIKTLKDINNSYGDYFTDKSPLFYAISTGLLKLNNNQGNKHKVKIINEDVNQQK